MSRLRDTIEQMERKLDKGDLDHLNRRPMLRQCLGAVEREAFETGYTEGMADAHDAQRAKDRAREQENTDGG